MADIMTAQGVSVSRVSWMVVALVAVLGSLHQENAAAQEAVKPAAPAALRVMDTPTPPPARLLFSENFDDRVVNHPFVARRYGEWNITPPIHAWGEGRGVNGYSFGSGNSHDVFISNEGAGGAALPDQIYLSYYIRYPSWIPDTDRYWNAKFFYLQERGRGAWEMAKSGNGSSGFFSQIRGDAGVVSDNSWGAMSHAWDGNWHRYEIYIDRVQGIYRFWYDQQLIIDRLLGQIMSASNYTLSFGSIDAQTTNEFTRFIDDIEIWEGMPSRDPA